MWRVCPWVLAALLVLLAAIPAPARQPEAGRPDADLVESSASTLAGRMPRSAELIVVFEGAAALRRSALWEALIPALGDTSALADTWTRLAQTLGWTPEETFDRVLGSRVALVVQGLPDHAGFLGGVGDGPADAGAEARWALISEVSADTERRLLERLAASPRNIVQGCQLLAVERGTYELAIYRPRGQAEAKPRSMLILAEAKNAALLDEMIGVLTDGAAAPMRGTPAHRALVGLGRADVAVLYRWPQSAGDAWSDYASVAIRREHGETWSTSLSVHDAALAPDLLKIPVGSDAAFHALGEDALAVIVETRVSGGDQDAPESDPAGVVLRMLGIPPPVQERLGPRQVLVVAENSPPGRSAAGMSVAVALELMDIPGAAPECDRYLALLASSLEGEDETGQGVGVPDFGGVAPGAVRSVPLRCTPGSLCRLLCGDAPPAEMRGDAAWTFAETGQAPGHGWWVIAAAPGGTDEEGAAGLVRRVTADLMRGPSDAGAQARWISQGMLRPVAILRRLGATAPAQEILGRLRELSWSVRATETGALEGTVQIKMSDREAGGPKTE